MIECSCVIYLRLHEFAPYFTNLTWQTQQLLGPVPKLPVCLYWELCRFPHKLFSSTSTSELQSRIMGQ